MKTTRHFGFTTYDTLSLVVLWLVFSGVCLGAVGQGDEGKSPINLIPYVMLGDVPELRKSMSDEDYAEKKKAALNELDREALLNGSRQLFSREIIVVSHGSLAGSLGLRVGDFLLAIDGEEMAPGHGVNLLLETPGKIKRTLRWETATGLQFQDTISGQDLGFNVTEYELVWRAAVSYLRSTETSSAWDDDMLVACQTMLSNPVLAETALVHAKDKGYRGLHGLLIATETRKNNLSYDDSLSFGYAALRQLTEEDEIIAALPMISAALLSGRNAVAAELAVRAGVKNKLPRKRIDMINSKNNRVSELPHGSFEIKKPYYFSQNLPFQDLTKDVLVLANQWMTENKIRNQERFDFAATRGNNFSIPIYPTIKNGRFRARIEVPKRPQGELTDPRAEIFFMLTGWDRKQWDYPALLFSLNSDGVIYLNKGADDRIRISCKSPEFMENPFYLTVTFIDGISEVMINDRLVYIGSLPTVDYRGDKVTPRYSFRLRIDSWSTSFSDLSWRSLGAADRIATQEKEPAENFHVDLIGQAKQMEKDSSSDDQVVSAYQRAVAFGDWNAKRAFADHCVRKKNYSLAGELYEQWAKESDDPRAWLHWAVHQIKHRQDSVDNILNKIRGRVYNVMNWQNNYDNFSFFFGVLRREGRLDELRYYLREIMKFEPNADAYVQTVIGNIFLGKWKESRELIKKVFSLKILNQNARVHLWTIDAALALAMNSAAPEPEEIYDLVNRGKVRKSVALGFAFFVGDIDEDSAMKLSKTIEEGDGLILYRAYKALAQGKHAEARKLFKDGEEKPLGGVRAEMAELFSLWYAEQPTDALVALVGTPEWPYQGSPLFQGNLFGRPPEVPAGANDF